jgi:hypothetical protein
MFLGIERRFGIAISKESIMRTWTLMVDVIGAGSI